MMHGYKGKAHSDPTTGTSVVGRGPKLQVVDQARGDQKTQVVANPYFSKRSHSGLSSHFAHIDEERSRDNLKKEILSPVKLLHPSLEDEKKEVEQPEKGDFSEEESPLPVEEENFDHPLQFKMELDPFEKPPNRT